MQVYEEISDYLTEKERSDNMVDSGFLIVKLSDYVELDIEEEDIERYCTPHKRNFFEITIARNDNAIININDTRFPITSNILDIISPFQRYSLDVSHLQNESEEEIRVDGYMILFKSSFLQPSRQSYELQQEFPYFRVHTMPRYKLSEDEITELMSIFENIHSESKKTDKDRIPIIQSYLNILLYKIKKLTCSDTDNVLLNRFEAITARFEQCIVSEEDHYLSVSKYADKMNISPVYLCECVKKTTGKSPREVIADYKLVHAKSLLQQADLSIADISETTGFSEVTNFTKFFKKNTGLTPIQFRKLQKP